MSDSKQDKTKHRIWFLLILGFILIEFPGVFFINRVHPYILGFPFIYGFVILVWIYMCFILFYAYKHNWGEKPDE